jgi:hypothetical protein
MSAISANSGATAAVEVIRVGWGSWGLGRVEAPVLALAASVDPEVKVEATRAKVCSYRRRLHEVSQSIVRTCHSRGVAEHVPMAVTL